MSTEDILDRCELHISLKEASVLLHDPTKGERVIRSAKYYGHNTRSIERLIEQKTFVDDNEKLNSNKFLVTFYGTKERAEQLMKIDANNDKKKKNRSSDSRLNDPSTSKDSQETNELAYQSRKTRQGASAHSMNNELLSTSLTTLRSVQALETSMEKLKSELKDLKNLFGEFLDSKDQYECDTGPTKEVALARQACKTIKKCRKQGFERKLAEIDWNEITQDHNKVAEIKNILTTQEWPSKMFAEIAEIIFGEKLITHILGRNGKRDRKPRKGERQFTITVDEEEKLRTVLSVFGTCFTSESAWQIMVQHYVNQRGRDIKNRKIKEEKEKNNSEKRYKRKYEDLDEENDSSNSPKKFQSDLGNNDEDDPFKADTEGERSDHSTDNVE